MINQFKQLGYGVLLSAAAALLPACSSDDGHSGHEGTPQQWHVSIPVGGGVSRGVYSPDEGASLKSKWDDGQAVVAYSGTAKVGDLTAAGNATGGSTLITGDISGSYEVGDVVTLYSPSKLTSPSYAEYAVQDGTIGGISSHDFIWADVSITQVDATNGILTTGHAAFRRLQSFTRFIFSAAVQKVVISAEGMSDITVTADADQTVFYVALPLEGTRTYSFVCTTAAGEEYTGSRPAELAHGMYYTASVDIASGIGMAVSVIPWGGDEGQNIDATGSPLIF